MEQDRSLSPQQCGPVPLIVKTNLTDLSVALRQRSLGERVTSEFLKRLLGERFISSRDSANLVGRV
jgi:hypothetical protein